MVEFQVADMTCGGCAASITRAVQRLDAAAKVDVDLAAHRVRIEPGSVDALAIGQAIADAGFTPEPVPG